MCTIRSILTCVDTHEIITTVNILNISVSSENLPMPFVIHPSPPGLGQPWIYLLKLHISLNHLALYIDKIIQYVPKFFLPGLFHPA